MIRALNTAGQGMIAQQLNVDLISNNLANVNTTGFKKDRLEFQDMLYETFERANVLDGEEDGEGRPVNLQVGHGVRPIATVKNFNTGNLQKTENPLDFAIEGGGFFKVETPNGTAYTRDGSFNLSVVPEGGMLTTSDGNPVLDEDDERIILPQDLDLNDLIVSEFGELSYLGKTAELEVGDISANFLEQVGSGDTDLLDIYNNVLVENMDEDTLDQIDAGEYEIGQDLVDIINDEIIGNEDFIEQIQDSEIVDVELDEIEDGEIQRLLQLREEGQLSQEESQELNLLVLQDSYPNSIDKNPNDIKGVPLNQAFGVVNFPNKSALESIGSNLYMGTEASGDEIANQDAFVVQNFLESSNVEIVEEMVDLITAQRAYETNSKAIQTADDMLNTANTLKR